jgi:DNA-binding transcriptional regulator of glucitol operon
VSPRPSKVRLLHPKWLLLHVLVIASCITMVWLGHWQWVAAHRRHGDIQNYAYAFQWWAFTGFAIIMWVRVVRDYLHPDGEQSVRSVTEQTPRYVGYVQPASATTEDTDPERARFNAYLRELNAADREETR